MSGAVVGVDVGGTFTDLILMEPETGAVRLAKVPSTPANQAAGVLAALDGAAASLAEVGAIIHGTTVTTNALLERKLSRCGLITTKGFRDILELGRRTRPRPYGLTGSFTPLIPRELRIEVPERMDAGGEVLVPLDEEAVRAALQHLHAAGCDSLVIHFLHSYKNPVHEERALAIARECWPEGHVTAGHAILAEFREFERGVAAAVNACVQPLLHRYLDRLQGQLAGRGYGRELLVIQGNGGSVSARSAAARAVNTVLSGPASGVMAAAAIGRAAGAERLITFDTGGTSADVGLVLDGVPAVTAEMELEHGMPIHVPMVDVHTVGAGGGSLARIDEAGLLQVGPESAGAQPGPICYGRGGKRPTLTDANLILGRLDPGALLAVENPVAPDDVRAVFAECLGTALGLDADAAAAAVIRIANDRMAGAIRMATLARGHDPRDFVLFAFGGAGPMHAAALAAELGIPRVMIPSQAWNHQRRRLHHRRPAPRLREHGERAAGRRGLGRRTRHPGTPGGGRARDHRTGGRRSRRDCVPPRGRHAVRGPDPPANGANRGAGRDARGTPERIRGRLLGALRGGAGHDPGGSGQPPHGGDRRQTGGAARRPRRPGAGRLPRRRADRHAARLVPYRLGGDAGLRP